MKSVVWFLILSVFLVSCNKKSEINSNRDIKDSTKNSTKDSILIKTKLSDTIKIDGEILPNKGFFDDLLALGLSNRQVLRLINIIRYEVDLRFIKVGEELTLYTNRDKSKVYKLIYQPNILTSHIIFRDSLTDSLVYKLVSKPFEKRYRLIRGTLENTLDESLNKSNVPRGLKNEITNALECKISFRYDARTGDKFYALIEEHIYNNKYVGGKALYTAYDGKRTGFHNAYWFEYGKKSSYNGFYTPDGVALINNAFRYPLDYIHVVSSFGWRVHPVLGVKKFHAGVDFRAAIGTPVYSAAVGVVQKTSYNRYGGKEIVIRHIDGTRTYYLHLSRILVRKGQRVKARQLIAKSGATGRITGPHLHFGIKSPKGKWVNPLHKRMIAVTKLKSDKLEEFKRQKKDIEKEYQSQFSFNLLLSKAININ